jgi:hypothetical protein
LVTAEGGNGIPRDMFSSSPGVQRARLLSVLYTLLNEFTANLTALSSPWINTIFMNKFTHIRISLPLYNTQNHLHRPLSNPPPPTPRLPRRFDCTNPGHTAYAFSHTDSCSNHSSTATIFSARYASRSSAAVARRLWCQTHTGC